MNKRIKMSGPSTILSYHHASKANRLAARLRSFIDAMEGRSKLRVGPSSIASIMDDAATLFEHLAQEKTRGRRSAADNKFLTKHPGKYFIRQGSILVNRAFNSDEEARSWAIKNYKNRDGWTLLHPL
jgi:hypothetical protein